MERLISFGVRVTLHHGPCKMGILPKGNWALYLHIDGGVPPLQTGKELASVKAGTGGAWDFQQRMKKKVDWPMGGRS